jgi:hypothetical protein
MQLSVPYLVTRDHFIERLYHQRTGYWQPDGRGLEPRRSTPPHSTCWPAAGKSSSPPPPPPSSARATAPSPSRSSSRACCATPPASARPGCAAPRCTASWSSTSRPTRSSSSSTPNSPEPRSARSSSRPPDRLAQPKRGHVRAPCATKPGFHGRERGRLPGHRRGGLGMRRDPGTTGAIPSCINSHSRAVRPYRFRRHGLICAVAALARTCWRARKGPTGRGRPRSPGQAKAPSPTRRAAPSRRPGPARRLIVRDGEHLPEGARPFGRRRCGEGDETGEAAGC